jgi:hypothetical protein
MISAHIERLHDCLEELKPLFAPHWRELALNQDRVALDPQYELYLQREAAGEVLCATLRERGALIAYFVGFVAPGMHYRSCLTLTMDIFWVHPEQRASDSLSSVEEELLWIQLFECVLEEAKRRGVKRTFFGSKVHQDAGPIFERMGMVPVDVYYSGWLGD